MLAQGEVSDATLARWQARLADEARKPLLLLALRGERSTMNDVLEKIHGGDLDPKAIPQTPQTAITSLFLNRNIFRENQAYILRHMTRAVEASRLPDDKATQEIVDLDKEFTMSMSRAWAIDRLRRQPTQMLMPAVLAATHAFVRHRVSLTTARVAMAADVSSAWPRAAGRRPSTSSSPASSTPSPRTRTVVVRD